MTERNPTDVLAHAKSIVKQFYPDMPDNYEGRRVQIAIAALQQQAQPTPDAMREAVEQIAENANCSEYGKKHTDGSRSGGQPPNPADVMLPCPFCGGEPNITNRASNETATGEVWYIVCMCGGYAANAHQWGPSFKEAIAAWNTRRKATQREENLATALRVTAGACADQVNTIVQLRAEIAAYQQAQPAVSVTDDMVERAAKVLFSLYRRNTLPAWDKHIMRQTLEAAFTPQ